MPWKYIGSLSRLSMLAYGCWLTVPRSIGYRWFSAFLASDLDFAFFRWFDTLSTRVILALQDRVAEVEASLEAIDNDTSRRSDDRINNGSLREDPREDRTNLLWEAQNRLDDYCMATWASTCGGVR
jgi:hypothetical protein